MVLRGGYQTYRRAAQKKLYQSDLGVRFVVLDGGTGCGKTAILQRAASLGLQVIDLEDLAQHRGSLFGALSGVSQPSQKWFETVLLDKLDSFDVRKPILVEAESNKIGKRTLPPAVWQAMRRAPRIELTAPLEARASYLLKSYAEVVADRELLEAALSRLEVFPGRKRLQSWRLMADAGQFLALVQEVVERHYDPSYTRANQRDERPLFATLALSSLDEAEQDAAAREVVNAVTAISAGAHWRES